MASIVTVLQGVPPSSSQPYSRPSSLSGTSSNDEGASHPSQVESDELLGAAGGATPPSSSHSRLRPSVSRSSAYPSHPLCSEIKTADDRDAERDGTISSDLGGHDVQRQLDRVRQPQLQQQQQQNQFQNRPFGLVGSTGSKNKKKSR